MNIIILNLFRISIFEFRILNQPIVSPQFNHEEASQRNQKIYQTRESPDPPGGFGFQGAGKVDQRAVSEVFATKTK
ncbi:MAG: hypothetical protein G01um101430_120 [Parcubacteria group bacterium Gr01-1014_30]|nr:MAG: hypothetical protein G01um101430_120 [Parcubacteria group bacterium Gr01-1014_30]